MHVAEGKMQRDLMRMGLIARRVTQAAERSATTGSRRYIRSSLDGRLKQVFQGIMEAPYRLSPTFCFAEEFERCEIAQKTSRISQRAHWVAACLYASDITRAERSDEVGQVVFL